MQEQLEHELRHLVSRFAADVKLAVLRSLQSAFNRAGLGADNARLPDGLASAGLDRVPAQPATARRTLTSEELAVIRIKLTTLIRQQPGQSTAQLARSVGIPTGKLRMQLRQLIDEGVIEIEEKLQGGLKRHTYRAAQPRPEHRSEPVAMAAGASA